MGKIDLAKIAKTGRTPKRKIVAEDKDTVALNAMVSHLAAELRRPAAEVKEILEAFIANTVKFAFGGKTVMIQHFGAFWAKDRKGKSGYCGLTGTNINTPDARVLKFSPSKSMVVKGEPKSEPVATEPAPKATKPKKAKAAKE